jgi:hypothetical protein
MTENWVSAVNLLYIGQAIKVLVPIAAIFSWIEWALLSLPSAKIARTSECEN